MEQGVVITRENFHKVQRQGKMNLRLMILLFAVIWIVYGIASYVMYNTLFRDIYPDALGNYLIRYGIASIIWFFILIQLWCFSKLGRILFALSALISLYTLKDVPLLYELVVTGFDMKMMQLLSLLFMIMIKLITLGCMWYIYMDKAVCSIWSLLEMYEEQLCEDDETQMDVHTLVKQTAIDVQIDSENKLSLRIRTFSRRYAIALLILMYACLFVIYVAMFYMQYSYPNDMDGLRYVQRLLFLSCLFSALIWTLPMLTLFTYKRGTNYILMFVWCMEIIQFGWGLPRIYETFQTQHYQLPSILCFVICHIIRYALFIRISMHIFSNPFLNIYWSQGKKHKT